MRGSPAAALLSSELPQVAGMPPPAPAWAGPWTGATPGLISPSRRIFLPAGGSVAVAGGWPSAANMPSVSGNVLTYYPGFPASTTASTTTLTLHPGDLNTSSNGQVIADLEITGTVNIAHDDVQIKRCWIHNNGFFGIDAEPGAITSGHPAIIEDCLISSAGPGTTGVLNSNITVRRCRIRDSENGADLGANVLIEYCFIYPLYNAGASHADGIQTQSGGAASNLTIRENTIYSRGLDDTSTEVNGTSCIIMAVGTTSFTNITVDHNFFAGGAFALYGPQSTTGTNVQITNNHFSTLFGPSVGEFGPWTDATDEAVVTGNVKVDGSDVFIANLP